MYFLLQKANFTFFVVVKLIWFCIFIYIDGKKSKNIEFDGNKHV